MPSPDWVVPFPERAAAELEGFVARANSGRL